MYTMSRYEYIFVFQKIIAGLDSQIYIFICQTVGFVAQKFPYISLWIFFGRLRRFCKGSTLRLFYYLKIPDMSVAVEIQWFWDFQLCQIPHMSVATVSWIFSQFEIFWNYFEISNILRYFEKHRLFLKLFVKSFPKHPKLSKSV